MQRYAASGSITLHSVAASIATSTKSNPVIRVAVCGTSVVIIIGTVIHK